MTVDTNHNYSLATEDDEYPQGFSDEPEYKEPRRTVVHLCRDCEAKEQHENHQ